MTKEKLIEKFGSKINHMSCVYLRDGETHLRSLVDKCDTIIEIGTYQGVSACVLADYAKKVYTFDVEDLPLRKDILGTVDNVKFILVKNRADERKKVAEVFKKENVELCFLDGEHFNGEIEKDFDMCKECNNIIIHDYIESFKEVYEFVNSLKGYEKKVSDTFVLLRRTEKSKPEKKSRKKRK